MWLIYYVYLFPLKGWKTYDRVLDIRYVRCSFRVRVSAWGQSKSQSEAQ